MSTISAFQPFTSPFYKTNYLKSSPQHHSFALHFHKNAISTHNLQHLRLTHNSKFGRVRSAEDEAQIPETETAAAIVQEEAPEQTVAIPVSPSDKLIMIFQVH